MSYLKYSAQQIFKKIMCVYIDIIGEFIIGRVIKAMMSTWHPQCFTCEMCHKELADLGFIKNQGKNSNRYI